MLYLKSNGTWLDKYDSVSTAGFAASVLCWIAWPIYIFAAPFIVLDVITSKIIDYKK